MAPRTQKITFSFASFGRIGLACGGEPSGDFTLNELRILEQSHDFDPDDLIGKVLAHRFAVTNEIAKASVGVGAETTIVVDLARKSSTDDHFAIDRDKAVAPCRTTSLARHDLPCLVASWRIVLSNMD